MSRKFTTREKILLLICAVLFLGIFYYEVVWKSTSEAIAQYSTSSVEDELLAEQLTAQKMAQMQETIEKSEGKTTGTVAPYNNLENEIAQLNVILAGATSYNLDFEDATTDGSIIRRNINAAYHTNTYADAKAIMQRMSDCQYKCKIRDVSMSTTASSADAGTGLQGSGDIDVSLVITFYESVTDDPSIAGLEEYQDTSDQ